MKPGRLARLLVGPPEKNVSRLMIGVTEKSGKNNLDANTDRAGEKYVKSKRCLRILSHKKSPDCFWRRNQPGHWVIGVFSITRGGE